MKAATALLINPKYDFNVGGVLRACHVFGVDTLFWTGERVKHPRAHGKGHRLPREERMKEYNDITYVQLVNDLAVEVLFKPQPGYTPVAVELRENAEPLASFVHPEHALYVFGPEDGSVPGKILAKCHRFLRVESATRTPMNLAATANVVLHDRLVKLGG